MHKLGLIALLFCLASGAQAKTIAAAVSGPTETLNEVHQLLRDAGHTVLDVTPTHERTHALVFDLNQATPPNGWPVALSAVWEQGFAACTALRMTPTFTLNDKEAWLCSRDLSVALWQRFLDETRADVVLVVSVSRADRRADKVRWNVEVVSYGPSETVQRTIKVAKVPSPQQAVRQLVARALEGGGEVSQREVVRTLPKSRQPVRNAVPQPPVRVRLRKPVVIPEGCEGLPATLAVRASAAELSAYFAGAYEAGVPRERRGSAKAAWCDLVVSGPATSGVLANSKMQSLGYLLRCDGGPKVSARGLGISEAHARLEAAPRLVQELVNAMCGK